MELIICKAKLVDLKEIQNLSKELFLHDNEYDDFLNLDWSYQKYGENYFKDAIKKNRKYLCLVAKIKDKVVGYLVGFMWKKWPARPVKIAELDNIIVTDSFRNRGVGEKLVQEFIEWCKTRKVKSVYVMSYSKNSNALAFYRKNGFVDMAQRMEIKL